MALPIIELNLSRTMQTDYGLPPASQYMDNGLRCISLSLLLLFSSLFAGIVRADESTDNSLEARDIQATFSSDELTIITWRNIQTNDYILLDSLRNTSYEIFRSAVVMNATNILSLSPIATGIMACEANESNPSCSSKQHSFTWQSEPGTEGTFHYGIVSVLENESRTATLTIGKSQSSPTTESVHPIWAPLRVSASYDAANESTFISWVNADEVGLSVPTNRTIWVWRHLSPVANNSWGDMDKSIIATLSSSANSYEYSLSGEVEESAYYSVTYRFDTWEDLRFIGSNTMTIPVSEDNVAPVLVSLLGASFDVGTGITSLSWLSGVIEEELVTQVWRASHSFTEVSGEGVVLLAELPHNATSYDYTIPLGSNGEFWYAVTLRDEVGNVIDNLGIMQPTAGPILERTIELSESVATGLTFQITGPQTTIQWQQPSGASTAKYHIWRSNSGEVDNTCLQSSSCELVEIVNTTEINIETPSGVERDSWYGVTIEAIWAEASDLYHHKHLISGLNSRPTHISEDADAPNEVSDLSATFYGPDFTTTLEWSGSEVLGLTYHLWRIQGDWSHSGAWNVTQPGWEEVGSIGSGPNNMTFDYITANTNSALTTTYAISVEDAHGNHDTILTAGAVSLVEEDMLSPSILVAIIPNGQSLPTESAWLNDGMSISFIGIDEGLGSLSIHGSEQLSTVSCRLLGDQSNPTTAWSEAIQDGIRWDCLIAITNSMKVDIRANDSAGNPTELVVSISTSEEQSIPQPTDENNGVAQNQQEQSSSTLEGENAALRIAFSFIAFLLFAVVILMLVKTRKQRAPAGKPTSKEDSWIARFID